MGSFDGVHGHTIETELAEALDAFDLGGRVTKVTPYGQGHINSTYAVSVACHSGEAACYLVQRINTHIFKDPVGLMENITAVTSHLKKKIAPGGGPSGQETLTVVPAKNGDAFCRTSDGGCWRVYLFVEGGVSFQKATSPAVLAAAAQAFGHFTGMLADFPADSLHITIPKFHDTRARFENLVQAAKADACGRAQTCPEELAFAMARQAHCGVLMGQMEAGQLPLRVTHNDTKLNNVLIEPATNRPVCVIDLDTVMPGLIADDFGDAVRTGAATAVEDEQDLELVHFDIGLYHTYSKAYLQALGGALGPAEVESLPWGARLMTFENGIRFLADYLNGDTYFKTGYDTHNLVRCRTQFKLVAEMEAQWDAMQLGRARAD